MSKDDGQIEVVLRISARGAVACRHVDGVSSLWLSLDGGLTGEPPRVFNAGQQRLFPDPDRIDAHTRSRHISCAPSTTSRPAVAWMTDRARDLLVTAPVALGWARLLLDHLIPPGTGRSWLWKLGKRDHDECPA